MRSPTTSRRLKCHNKWTKRIWNPRRLWANAYAPYPRTLLTAWAPSTQQLRPWSTTINNYSIWAVPDPSSMPSSLCFASAPYRHNLMVGLPWCSETFQTNIPNKWYCKKLKLPGLNSDTTSFICLLISRYLLSNAEWLQCGLCVYQPGRCEVRPETIWEVPW